MYFRSMCLAVLACAHLAGVTPFVAAGMPSRAIKTQAKAARPFQFMTRQKELSLRAQLPTVDDPDMRAMLHDPALILYTDAEIPPAYQDWNGSLNGIHSIHYNISANDSEPFGNGNREFPWNSTGGTHRTKNVKTFRFLWLPRDEKGKQLPVVWHRRHLNGDSSRGYAWTFPVGTVFGEVLRMRSPSGRYYTFEMRLRIRESGDWGVDVFRPFPTHDDLAVRIKELRPTWEQNERLAKIVNSLQRPKQLKKHKLVNKGHSRQVFRQSAGVDSLPSLNDTRLTAELLTKTPFRTTLEHSWRIGSNGVAVAAPTTRASFHIVPANYDAGFIHVTRSSCIRCHNTVNQSVNNFDFSRDWYGRIRGSDGIFSFHPFDPSCVSRNGMGAGVRMNRRLVSAGLLQHYDRDRHPPEIYNSVPHLSE